jgi:hypothetical protein
VQSSEPRRQNGETICHLFRLSRRIDFLFETEQSLQGKS